MTPSWYDVLGVDETATADEIRAAWKESVEGLDPTDRRFKQRNRAAEVLLDPVRRAAHDAELAAQDQGEDEDDGDRGARASERLETSAADKPDLAKPADGGGRGARASERLETPAADVPDPNHTRGPSRRTTAALGVLAGLLALATLVSLVLGGGASSSEDDGLPDQRAIDAARTAAAAAIVPLLSYDYRDLETSKQAALVYLSPAFAEKYEQNFAAVIETNATKTETVITTEVATTPDGSPAVGVARTGEGLVEVLLFVNRPTSNIERQEISADQVTARMIDVDGTWLVDCLYVDDAGRGACPS